MTAPSHRPSVLFVCVRNGGKSQMAAGLLRQAAGDDIEVHSAGTQPGKALNALSVEVLAEKGADISAETPKAVDPMLLRRVDLVITLGRDAQLDTGDTELRNWDTDEPSARGIDGIDRMRLVRDDIAARVAALNEELVQRAQIHAPDEQLAVPVAEQSPIANDHDLRVVGAHGRAEGSSAPQLSESG